MTKHHHGAGICGTRVLLVQHTLNFHRHNISSLTLTMVVSERLY